MNHVTEAAAAGAQYGWVLGVMTGVFLVTFTGWVWYAYRPGNKERMEEAGRLPLADLETP